MAELEKVTTPEMHKTFLETVEKVKKLIDGN
jgi:hypothetical protein